MSQSLTNTHFAAYLHSHHVPGGVHAVRIDSLENYPRSSSDFEIIVCDIIESPMLPVHRLELRAGDD